MMFPSGTVNLQTAAIDAFAAAAAPVRIDARQMGRRLGMVTPRGGATVQAGV